MTNRRWSEILADENREIFWEKVKGHRNPRHFLEIWGKSETGAGEMYHCLRGDGRPWPEPVV